MPFFNGSLDFTLGFEAGMLWEKIKEGACLDYHPVHRVNIEQIKLICEANGVVLEVSDGDETWSFITIRSAIECVG